LRHTSSRGTTGCWTLVARALDDKLERTIDRVYACSGCLPIRDVAAACTRLRTAIAGHAPPRWVLDNTRPVDLAASAVIEGLPIAEQVRRGNLLLSTRPRELEDALVHLVHDEDAVVAASAIHFVEQRRIWSLAPDLEWTLEHRRVTDWPVFEAASWALAARRLAERRWDLWLEPVPSVELVDRLRAIRLFDFVSVDELFRIAAAARQVRHEPGREIYHEAASRAQFLIEGMVHLSDGDAAREVNRLAALAFDELLEGRPLGHSARAADRGLPRDRAHHPLNAPSDNVEAQGLFRLLLDRPRPAAGGSFIRQTAAIRLCLRPFRCRLPTRCACSGNAALRQGLGRSSSNSPRSRARWWCRQGWYCSTRATSRRSFT
jgi:hypothetical protein